MIGVDRNTGKTLSGLDHFNQSVRDILTTRKGTRVMRRTYGTNLFEYIDKPVTQSLALSIYREASEALAEWEPRISVSSIGTISAGNGSLSFVINGTYLPDGTSLSVPVSVV